MYKATLTLLFAALACGQSVNPSLVSEISSIDEKIQTAYTTDPGWSSFTRAMTSWESEFLSTNTITDGLTSLLPLLSTATDRQAVISSISVSVSRELAREHDSGFVQFVSTQTILGSGAGSSLHSDLTRLVSLVSEATATATATASGRSRSGTSAPTSTTGASTSTTRTSTATSRITVSTGSTSTTTSTSPTAATPAPTTSRSGSDAGPGINGVFGFVVAGVVAVAALL
ncbi:hypothetical protein FN846DRAFT_931573 [Sphaerosporella brunnea]|uniref:Hydrophobic surface binding protein A-domain-containing protein n=1 Tax=Sphaerosporella brunnea TaxID=1250544 RepID=A0A5J5F877_9PEZI|nr:hypothetical protein FN846DRAFT_931573 [Sphaerosporella brunnea]